MRFSSRKKPSPARRLTAQFLQFLGAVFLTGAILGTVVLLLAGYWLRSEDIPTKADAIVLLGGDYSRPLYGADLYHQGYAPVVLVSRPVKDPMRGELEKLSIDLPSQSEVYAEILRRKGVPEKSVVFFGNGSVSTVEEARVLAGSEKFRNATLMVVTSPFHTRRAEIIFENALPHAEIIMIATPYEEFPRKWWADFRSARNVILETAKIIFYHLGGAFQSRDNATPPAP